MLGAPPDLKAARATRREVNKKGNGLKKKKSRKDTGRYGQSHTISELEVVEPALYAHQ